jgi:CheY-like chemotaxis protein
MLKVLIAENDLLMADMLEESLLDAGYEVCGIASSVEEGVALGELHKPDFAILDLRLTDGGLGTEIAARLDRMGGLGILYATGNAGQIGLSKDDGDACLDKPYRPADVIRALKIVGDDRQHRKSYATLSRWIPPSLAHWQNETLQERYNI